MADEYNPYEDDSVPFNQYDYGNESNPYDNTGGPQDGGYTTDDAGNVIDAANVPPDSNSSVQTAGNWLQRLLGHAPGKTADLASILGAFSSGNKANRMTQGELTQRYDQLMQNAQTGRNQNESDAMRKMASTSYIMNGGSKATIPSLTLNGKTYGAPMGESSNIPPVSDAEKAGATTLQSQLLARLSPGGSYTPQPLSSYATPGTAENIGSDGAAILGGLGALENSFRPESQNPSTQNPSTPQPIRKAIPGQPGEFVTSTDGGGTWT